MTNSTNKIVVSAEYDKCSREWSDWYHYYSANDWIYLVIELEDDGDNTGELQRRDISGIRWSPNGESSSLETLLIDAGWPPEAAATVWRYDQLNDLVSEMMRTLTTNYYISQYLKGAEKWDDIRPFNSNTATEQDVREAADYYSNISRYNELNRRVTALKNELGSDEVVGYITFARDAATYYVHLECFRVYNKTTDVGNLLADHAVRALIESTGATKLRRSMIDVAKHGTVYEFEYEGISYSASAAFRNEAAVQYVDVTIRGNGITAMFTVS